MIIYDAKNKSERIVKDLVLPVESIVLHPTETDLLKSQVIALESRLTKIEAVPIVKATLEPAPIIIK